MVRLQKKPHGGIYEGPRPTPSSMLMSCMNTNKRHSTHDCCFFPFGGLVRSTCFWYFAVFNIYEDTTKQMTRQTCFSVWKMSAALYMYLCHRYRKLVLYVNGSLFSRSFSIWFFCYFVYTFHTRLRCSESKTQSIPKRVQMIWYKTGNFWRLGRSRNLSNVLMHERDLCLHP